MDKMELLNEKESIDKFNKLMPRVNELLNSLELNLSGDIIKPEWDNNRVRFRNKISSGFDINFLKDSGIGGLMFQGDSTLANIEFDKLDKSLLHNINEYNISNKNFNNSNYHISTNTIHHTYHLDRFFNKKGGDSINSILEWGGGYGNMAKISFEIFKNLNTYTIIDLPEFIVLQYIYLVSYFGEDNVRIIKSLDDIGEGINLIPVNVAMENDIQKHDMFISTWAISESSLTCQEYAELKGFFDYDNSLISYHQCGDHIPFMAESTILDNRLKDKGYQIEDIIIIPGINYYAIK